ncbi:protein RTF1 homolog [Phragmites australis]|uniref:protein RTF1 homolog n=1 Tax=Phragmites australis TaxID=29695 RepID=UPI002D79527E|nr:protein RTF1 homolog [Phragmites australis]
MSNLDDLLLQAAGRTGKNQSRSSNPRWQQQQRGRRGSSYSGGSGSDDDDSSDAAPTYSRKKKPPSGLQVPLKKRHQPEKGKRGGVWREDDDDDDNDDGRRSDGDDSDSAPSVGSDLYKDEDDKEQLEKMSELDREMILAERSTRIDDYKLKQLARASSSSKTEKASARKDSSPPPPPSRMRSSTRTDRGSATKSALDELRAKRMSKQDPEAYRNRFKDLLPQSGSPTRRRAGSPPSDGSNDGDNRGRMNDHGRIADDSRDDEFDESPSRLDPLKFDDVKSITLRRSKLVKWFMEPFFEELISGCFVRLGIGKTKSGVPKYRLCIVRNVDASDPDRQYKLESYTTCKYLNVVWDSEANAARWQMTQVSDSPPLEEEFKEWLQEAEKNGVRIPSRQEVLEKKEAIQKAYTFVYSAATVKRMLREKKSAVRRPINVAAEKDRLRSELDMALSRRDEAQAERIRAKLSQLQEMSQPMSNNEKAARLEAMNRKNRADNFKNASEMKPVNTSLKAGEAGYDPFSRRWTRSRNYYAAKPAGDNTEEVANESGGNNSVSGNEDVKNRVQAGTAATAAAQVAAADAGKLVDTNAPVDLGTELNVMHTFELPISLSVLNEYGGPKGLFDGYMARKQKIEATMGYKVPDNDGRRHALTLSVSDYKRRRGLL